MEEQIAKINLDTLDGGFLSDRNFDNLSHRTHDRELQLPDISSKPQSVSIQQKAVEQHRFYTTSRGFSQGAGSMTLLNAQRTRSKMERDAQLLANRIALLKQEEMRTWKKIEETRNRTKDILTLKQKNYVRITNQQTTNKKEGNHLKSAQTHNYEEQKKKNQDKRDLLQEVQQLKAEQANQIKKLTKKNEKKKVKFMKRVQSENQLKGSIIRQYEQYQRLKKEASMRNQLDFVKKVYDSRVKVEEKQISKKERELMQMEMLEMELIKNLQNTQSIQKNAYSDLEKALMLQTLQDGGPLSNFEPFDPENAKLKKKKKKRRAESTAAQVNNL